MENASTQIQLWFSIDRDYRDGVTIHCKKKDFDGAEGDLVFDLPDSGYRLYVVELNLDDDDTIIYQCDCKSTKNYTNVINKIFSQVHSSLPFEVTGKTSGYVDEGDYPEIPEHIKKMPNIVEINKIDPDSNSYCRYFIVVLNCKGKCKKLAPLLPIF